MPAPIRVLDKDGFPIPSTFDEPAPTVDSKQRPRRVRKSGGLWKWALLLVFPIAIFGRQIVELGWDYAAGLEFKMAVENEREGMLDEALDHANLAIDWEPEGMRRWRAYLLRAEIQNEKNMSRECLADCDAALKYATRGQQPEAQGRMPIEALKIYMTRAWALQRLGRTPEALADCTTAIKSSAVGPRDELASMYNHRAYIAALSGIELGQASEDINRAIQMGGYKAEFADTRAVIRLKQGQASDALEDMDTAIRMGEVERNLYANTELERFLDRGLAVMYHHRSQVHEKLGNHDQAARDSQLAAEKGYDPSSGE